jgi:hypothetical protein
MSSSRPRPASPDWDEYWRDVGVPEDELGLGADLKNRLRLDVHASGGRAVPFEVRRQRVDAEARRLAGLGATMAAVHFEEGIDHYGGRDAGPGGQRVRYQLTGESRLSRRRRERGRR